MLFGMTTENQDLIASCVSSALVQGEGESYRGYWDRIVGHGLLLLQQPTLSSVDLADLALVLGEVPSDICYGASREYNIFFRAHQYFSQAPSILRSEYIRYTKMFFSEVTARYTRERAGIYEGGKV